jgi:hypothetical protein
MAVIQSVPGALIQPYPPLRHCLPVRASTDFRLAIDAYDYTHNNRFIALSVICLAPCHDQHSAPRLPLKVILLPACSPAAMRVLA